MKCWLKSAAWACVVMLGVGCNQLIPVKPPSNPETETTAPTALGKASLEDIGDVEAALRFAITVAQEARGANVVIEDTQDAMSRLIMSSVTVKAPFPKELPLSVTIKTTRDFQKHDVVLRAKILRDKEVIGTLNKVFNAETPGVVCEERINALAGLETPPASLLISAQAEVMFVPTGADPATVDIPSLEIPKESMGAVMSNPVRITFASGG